MKKKMVSMAMAAVMAATLMVAAAPAAEVNAASNSNVKVTYENTSVIVDPDSPEVMVKVPANIAFTDYNETIDASVSLQAVGDGDVADYTGSATVAVTSANGFKLKFGEETLDYTLKYTGATANDGVVGTLSADKLTIGGQATLSGNQVATQLGTYSDTLTYAITFNNQ